MKRSAVFSWLAGICTFFLNTAGVVAVPEPVIRFDRITTEDGLSENHVTTILQDSLGFLWFGTRRGLNRYDGVDFEVYRQDPADPKSLAGSWIIELLEDPSGDLWVGTADQGLCRWHRARDEFTCYRHRPDDSGSLSGNHIEGLHQQPDGTLWIGTAGSGLNRWHPSAGEGVFERFRHDPAEPGSLGHDGIRALAGDRDDQLWVGTLEGLDRYDPETNTFVHYRHDPNHRPSLGHDNVNALLGNRGGLWVGHLRGVDQVELGREDFQRLLDDPSEVHWTWDFLEDSAGRLWIARDDGLYLRRPEEEAFVRYRHDPADPSSLSDDQVFALHQDTSGVLWAGTHNGISKWNPATWSFGRRPHDHGVTAFSEDPDRGLWIGTLGGGLDHYDRETGESVRFSHDPEEPESLADDRVTALLHDRQGALWVGTRAGGLHRFDADDGSFQRFQHDPEGPGSLSNNWVGALLETRDGELWVGSHGLCRFVGDRSTTSPPTVGPFDCHLLETEKRNFVFSLAEDRSEMIWASTNIGLLRLDPASGGLRHFVHDPDVPQSLANDFSLALHVDPSGVLWVGTSAGLDRLVDLDDGTGEARFEHFGEQPGLPSASVIGIQSDDQGFLWLVASQGLSRFDPRTRRFENFDRSHGLQGNDFYQGGYRSPSGELFFGGTEGFNAFFPDNIRGNRLVPPVRLTEFSKLGRPFDLGRPLHQVEEIRLDHRDTMVAFEFAALDYTAPRQNRYAYRLDGLTDDWIDLGTTRQAAFTGLSPGSYVFRVKGSNNDGVWNEEGVAVKLVVAPPPWKSWWAYSLMALALLGGVVGYARHQQRRVEREQAVSQRLRELDRLKDEFLANTSHELRTPLYGIIGLAERMRDSKEAMPPSFRDLLGSIVASGHRLQRLVGNLLDFSRLEQDQLELVRRPLNLKTVVGTVLARLRPLADDKQLALVQELPDDLPSVEADEHRLEEILLNLVGNAIKFTESGEVSVSARLREARVEVEVRDTGRGIASEDHERIFGVFEQADGSTMRRAGGTGLGLAVSRHLVELHGGELSVRSRLGEGATFSFTLPKAEIGAELPPVVPPPSPGGGLARAVSRPTESGPAAADTEKVDKGRILVVDDEPVNRLILRQQLELYGYEVREAVDGLQALERLEDVDLVLLDVMMPRMTGFEACRKLRERFHPTELPVIFVTAKDRPEDLTEGFDAGGNDYLGKPIGMAELVARVQSHLKLLEGYRRLRE